jgi:hypothetical protein
MATNKKVFINKNVGSTVYKWSPSPNDFSNKTNRASNQNVKDYCNATAGSQGEDWITRYVYDDVLIDYQQARIAYVECDYVQ